MDAAMVKEICDIKRGVERKNRRKREKAFQDADLAKNLELAIETVIGLRVGFEAYCDEAWTEVEEASPHLIRSLITELDNLTSFMKG